jgi:hypothetical protein
MNVNAQMQTQSASKAQAKASGEVDALSALGQQLEITPEMLEVNPELAQLLEGNPEGLDFAQLLDQEDGKSAKGQIGKLSDLMKGLKDAAGELGEEIKTTGKDGGMKSIIVDPNNPKTVVDGNNNAKQFIPERKSIFDTSNVKTVNVAQTDTVKLDTAKASNGLQNLSELVQNQVPSKKIDVKNGYKSSLKDSLFAKKADAQFGAAKGLESAPMKVTDLMLMSDNDSSDASGMNFSSQNQPNQTTALQSTGKVFDMSQLTSTNTEEVIGKIQDYIVQSKVSSDPNVKMSFEHKELGMIDLQVSKLDNNQLNIMINSRSQEGAKFFTQNQGELLQTLSQAGIQVADLKLDSSSNTSQNQSGNDSSMAGQQKESGQGSNKQQRDADSQRREELWKLFEGQEAA